MIDELERFILASKEGNITKAAEKIFITQSALSQSIKRLETELGTELFTQKGKQLQLTPDGKAVITIGSKILQLWHNMKNPNVREDARQTYSIGLFDNAALYLGKYFQDTILSDRFRIDLTINASGELFSQLKWGMIDLAICVTDKRAQLPKSIMCIETFSEELIPVSSQKYSGHINTVPFIFYNRSSNTRHQVDETFSENAVTPTVFAESTSTTFMKELAILGSGVALLPKNFVASELRQGILKKQKLPFTVKREYGVYIQNQSALAKDHEIIKDICQVLRK